MYAIEDDEMEKLSLEEPDALKTEISYSGVLRDRVFNGMRQGVSRQNHLYGIDCKLSGSVFLASEIEGAVPIVHGPRGCAFHQRISPRKVHYPVFNLPSTDLGEDEVIYGGEEKLRQQISEVYDKYRPDLIIVLPTCVSGLIGDDVASVVEEARSVLPCDLIHVPSEGFAHRGRESLDFIMNYLADAQKDPSKSKPYELRGCGQEEVMFSLADQLMEERDAVENLVNLESYGRFTCSFWMERREVDQILSEMGARLNATIPASRVDQIKGASVAELNIISTRNNRWAEKMKSRFGTDYIRKWHFCVGFDRIENFFLEVGSRLGLEGEAEEAVRRQRSKASDELEKYRRVFKGRNFAIFSQSMIFNPYLAEVYARDLALPIKYLCIDAHRLEGMNISEGTRKAMIDSMSEVLEGLDLGFELVIDPDQEEMKEISKEVGYFLSDRFASSIYDGPGRSGDSKPDPSAIGMIDIAPMSAPLYRLSFRTVVRLGRYLSEKMVSGPRYGQSLIARRFEYDRARYPMISDPLCCASSDMWHDMWTS